MLRNYAKENNLEIVLGLDEVGRGCFAGPVVTAAVALPKEFKHELIRDSKKLTPTQRKKAYKIIKDNAIAISCNSGSVKQINKYGINPATFIAMNKCISEINKDYNIDHLLIDGTVFDGYEKIKYSTVPKGDDTFLSIAAAAIVAKVERDAYMVKLHEHFPHYNFSGSKGYYCKKHGEGILSEGVTPYHRSQYVNTWLKKQK